MELETADITPLSLDEVEKFCFEHKRIYFEDLDRELKGELEDLIGEAVPRDMGDPEYAEARIPKLLSKFNATTLKKYTVGTFTADAQAGFKIKRKSPLDIDLWIDFYGIEQASIDHLPLQIKRNLMDKYLGGWRDLTADPNNNKQLLTLLSEALREEFAYSKADDEEGMEYRARIALLKTGIVDEVKCNWSEYMHRMDIRLRLVGQTNHVNFTANIQ